MKKYKAYEADLDVSAELRPASTFPENTKTKRNSELEKMFYYFEK